MIIHRIYDVIFRIWRKRRFAWFLDAIQPTRRDTLIDVGGLPKFWTKYPPCVGEIHTINLTPVEFDSERYADYHITCMVGDGCHLPMEDNTYDIVFSNSVIEHVGTDEQQAQFAREVRRVGRRLWMQTPALGCPLEPHYLAPFVHWLPVAVRRKVLRYLTPWGWMTKPDQSTIDEVIAHTRLLSKRRVRELFPDCEIITERLLWVFPKSYIAVRRTEKVTEAAPEKASRAVARLEPAISPAS